MSNDDKPASDKPASDKPASDKPASDKPASDKPDDKPATRVTTLGREPERFLGAVNTPVFRATTMVFPTTRDLEAAARGQYAGIVYGLHGLPTVLDLQRAIADLEGGHAALAVPSGLTATTLPFLALTQAGDH